MEDLYDDGKIKITPAQSLEEHDLFVGDLHCYLSRGILKECAGTDSVGLVQRIGAFNSDFLNRLPCRGISLERLGWALAKARISELEDEVGYFIREYNELKTKTDE